MRRFSLDRIDGYDRSGRRAIRVSADNDTSDRILFQLCGHSRSEFESFVLGIDRAILCSDHDAGPHTCRTPPFWQIGLAILINAAAIAGLVWLTSRVYRVGMLMYGKRATIPEVWKWIRHA